MSDLAFEFTIVEETPFLPLGQAVLSSVLASITLISGIIMNLKVLRLLMQRKLKGCTAPIDNLSLVYCFFSLLCHPPLLVKISIAFF